MVGIAKGCRDVHRLSQAVGFGVILLKSTKLDVPAAWIEAAGPEVTVEKRVSSELPAGGEALLELGIALGQSHAFGMVAGRCSAAQAESIRRLRDGKLFKECCESWEDFCPQYLKMSRAEADRMIRLLEEFGPAYFELAQLTRVSAETYRAIQPAIRNGSLHYQGEAIEITPENSHKVAAAVAELRRAIPCKAEPSMLARGIQAALHDMDASTRIDKLERFHAELVAEFEKIAADKSLTASRLLLNSAVTHARDEMARLAAKTEES
jgi:hypothetical protein